MEVVAVATNVCSLCQTIVTWIDQQAEKQYLFSQIASTVQQIHDILTPFSESTAKPNQGTGEAQLSQCIRSVGDILRRTRDHLLVWKSSRTQKILAFLNPSSVIQRLKEDERRINHQLVILITSIATVGYFRERDKGQHTPLTLTEWHSESTGKVMEKEMDSESDTLFDQFDPLQELDDQCAREFWAGFIGSKIDFVDIDLFSCRLAMWYRTNVNQKAFESMIMRLDEYSSGVVTPYNLSRALERKSLREFVDVYIQNHDKPIRDAADAPAATSPDNLWIPLLVWIDDNPDEISYEIEHAQSSGMCVVHLPSTAIAKSWIEANITFLRQHDNASDVRYISDNVRIESGVDTGPYLNPTAGQAILRYLRGRLINAPVLIYTGHSIRSTGYVSEYDSAGSTDRPGMCIQYITSFVARMRDDNDWKGYHASLHIGSPSSPETLS